MRTDALLSGVHFTRKDEAELFFSRLGVGPSGPKKNAPKQKAIELRYTSRLETRHEAGDAIAHALGAYQRCMVWPFDLVWGDRSLEATVPPHWRDYKLWRQRQGATAALYEEPGHLFEEDERESLAGLIGMAIDMGWDALIGSRASRLIIALSHHDSITLYARSTPSRLIEDLSRLGIGLEVG